ncbi:MAG: MarR family winged helix-turn-helix transcriptional regulator, partial [Pseudonocardiaceae bacterium]
MLGRHFGDEFGYVVKQAQQAYRAQMDRTLARFALSTPQYVALAALDQLDGACNAELARACFVTPQSMHEIVAALERRDLISRPRAPETGRALPATLTDEGRTILAKA